MYGINVKTYSLVSSLFRLSVAVCVTLGLVLGSVAIAGINTQAYAGSGACERDTKCGIGGKTFEAIYYSTFESGLVVLYDKGMVGTLKPWVSEKKYTKGTGTVEDAISFLTGDPYYVGYSVKKGKKSTGFFRSETVEGLYIVEPRYEVNSNNRASSYRFVDKDGTLTLYITDFDRGQEDDSGS